MNRSAAGITIQRGIELSYMGQDGDERYDPLNPFTEESFGKLLTVFNGFGQCGYSSGTGSSSWTGQLCNTEEDCGAGISCLEWSTFYGTIHFDSYGLNSNGDVLIIQIYNDTQSGQLSSRVIGPSTTSVCNEKGDCDSERDWSCQCDSVYPAVFYWTPKISFFLFIKLKN